VVRLVLAASYGEVPADAGHRRPRESAAHSGSINKRDLRLPDRIPVVCHPRRERKHRGPDKRLLDDLQTPREDPEVSRSCAASAVP